MKKLIEQHLYLIFSAQLKGQLDGRVSRQLLSRVSGRFMKVADGHLELKLTGRLREQLEEELNND